MQKFNANGRIVFLGDSITHNWTWVASIYQYYFDNVDSSIKMYDCGSAGGTAKDAWQYRNIDLYRYDPTHVHIMFGVNDIGRGYYREDAAPDEIQMRHERMQVYKKSMTDIVKELLFKQIKVTLATPLPYDTETVSDAENLAKCADALVECSDFIRKLCAEYELEYVDFNREITALNRNLHKSDKSSSVFLQDRIHPAPEGYMSMARIFLNEQGFKDVDYPDANMITAGKTALPIKEKITALKEASDALRSLTAVERMLLTNEHFDEYFNKPDEIRIKAMQDRMKEFNENTIQYFHDKSKFYVENLMHYEEMFQKVIQLTEKIHK